MLSGRLMKLNHMPLPRIKTQTTLVEYMHSLDLISNSLGMPCILLDENNTIVYVNSTFCEIEDTTSEQLLNTDITANNIPKFGIYQKFAKQIQQHHEIITLNQKRIYLEINHSQTLSIANIVYKTPIFDSNSKLICLHLQYKPFTIARLANLGAKFHGVNSYPTNRDELQQAEITRMQQMIIYLYARNYSYTEVSSWLARFGIIISASAVNKQLNKLKKMFEVTDNQALKDMSLKLGYDFAIPTEFLPEGSHDITNDIFDLWVC